MAPRKAAASAAIPQAQPTADVTQLLERITLVLERQQQILDRLTAPTGLTASAAAADSEKPDTIGRLEAALGRHGEILQDMIDRGERLQREGRARADQRRAEVESLRGELAEHSVR